MLSKKTLKYTVIAGSAVLVATQLDMYRKYRRDYLGKGEFKVNKITSPPNHYRLVTDAQELRTITKRLRSTDSFECALVFQSGDSGYWEIEALGKRDFVDNHVREHHFGFHSARLSLGVAVLLYGLNCI